MRYIRKKKAGGLGGRGNQSWERSVDTGRLPATTAQQDKEAT